MTAALNRRRALLLTGVTGVGKSTVAAAIGGILTAAGFVTAVVDTDALAQFGPSSEGSAFYDRLKCVNLAAVWANYYTAGARFLVASAVIDSGSLRGQYAASLAGCDVQVARLVATTPPDPDEPDAGALTEWDIRFGAGTTEDFTVVNDRPATVVAQDVITRAGWPGGAD